MPRSACSHVSARLASRRSKLRVNVTIDCLGWAFEIPAGTGKVCLVVAAAEALASMGPFVTDDDFSIVRAIPIQAIWLHREADGDTCLLWRFQNGVPVKVGHFMHLAFIYLLLVLVVAGSCLLQYCGARWLASLAISKQNRVAIVSLALCALVLAIFRANMVATNCCVLTVALFAGTLLSRQIRSAGALATLLAAGAIADLISTQVGPSRWLASQAQHASGLALIQFLAVSIQLKGKLVPVIGVSDLMFFTVCVSAVRSLGWPETPSLGRTPFGGFCQRWGVGSLRRVHASASFPRRSGCSCTPTPHAPWNRTRAAVIEPRRTWRHVAGRTLPRCRADSQSARSPQLRFGRADENVQAGLGVPRRLRA
jgi:hypothetical protein